MKYAIYGFFRVFFLVSFGFGAALAMDQATKDVERVLSFGSDFPYVVKKKILEFSIMENGRTTFDVNEMKDLYEAFAWSSQWREEFWSTLRKCKINVRFSQDQLTLAKCFADERIPVIITASQDSDPLDVDLNVESVQVPYWANISGQFLANLIRKFRPKKVDLQQLSGDLSAVLSQITNNRGATSELCLCGEIFQGHDRLLREFFKKDRTLSRLSVVNLYGITPLRAECVVMGIRENAECRLETISFLNWRFARLAAQEIAEMLAQNKTIKRLSLVGAEIDSEMATTLLEGIARNVESSLENLNLCRNKIGSGTAQTIKKLAQLANIKTLSLCLNGIDSDQLSLLSKELSKNNRSRLVFLDLWGNKLDSRAYEIVRKMRKANTALEVNIGWQESQNP